ncbi:MAG: divalent-cation tolerance protein CutA [Deltaproteobacteria bacterium]|nr:MAG: divalent-cation tolerance protein CutA [Deltaproteobacteria bacterium]
MTDAIVIFTACASEEEALKIANGLVDECLAGCVSIVSPVRSIYRWEGRLCDEKEWLLIIKTGRERFEELEKKIKSFHSYSVPEIICLPILEGSLDYLEWLEETTRK